jgi:hypothetical protein
LVAEGLRSHNAFLVGVGLGGDLVETFGRPANVGSQLQTALLRDGFTDLVSLDLQGSLRAELLVALHRALDQAGQA